MIDEIKKTIVKMKKYSGKYILGFEANKIMEENNRLMNYVIGEREFIGELADKININSVYGEI